MILVDTSVWIDHLRRGDDRLARLLDEGSVASHPFVIGELACGQLGPRAEILALLSALPSVQLATHAEALRLVTDWNLMGRGIGWVDVHLLASALLSQCGFWTKDKALVAASQLLRLKHGGGRV